MGYRTIKIKAKRIFTTSITISIIASFMLIFQIYYTNEASADILWELTESINVQYNVRDIDWSADNILIAVGSDDNTVRIYNASNSYSIDRTFSGLGGDPYALAWSPDGKWLGVGTYADYKILLYNTTDWSLDFTFDNASQQIYDIDISPDSTWLAACSRDDNTYIYYYDGSNWALNHTVTSTSGDARGLAFSTNGNYLAVTSNQNIVYILNTSDWSIYQTLSTSNCGYSVAWSSNDSLISVGDSSNNVYVWSVASWSLLQTLTEGTNIIYSVDFSNNSNWLATGSADKNVRIYKVSDWSLNKVITNATEAINTVRFSDDNNWFAAGGLDNYVRIYYSYCTPTIITNSSLGVEETNATLKGYLSSDGGATTTCGLRYGTNSGIYSENFSKATYSSNTEFENNNDSLTQGQIYYYQAWANNSKGFSNGSEMTLLTKPNSPSSLTSRANSSSVIYLAWNTGNGRNTTYIERNASGATSWDRGEGTLIYNGTGTNYVETGLTAEVTYYYQAWSYTNWSYDSTILDQWSDANVSTSNIPNGIPTIANEEPSNDSTNVSKTPSLNITVNDADGDTMNITWYSNSSGTWQIFGTNSSVGNGTYSQINSNFSEYQATYWWNVTVTDGTHTNTSGIFHFSTPPIKAPTVITNVSTGIEETNTTLNGYLQDNGREDCTVRFEYGTTTDYGTNTSNQTKATGQIFSININNLTRGQIYHFCAYANNTAFYSTGSDRTFLTKPSEPSNLTSTAQGTSEISLSWKTGNGSNNTLIIRKTGSYPNNRTDGTQIYNSTGTNYSDSELSASTTYYYRAWSYTNWTYSSITLDQWSDNYNSASTTTASGSGGGGPYSPPPSSPSIPESNEEEPTTKEQIEQLYNITLSKTFSANDTNSDGLYDTFTDPNGILQNERVVTIDDEVLFLLSVDDDLDKLFLWNPSADAITLVNYTLGEITNIKRDGSNNRIVITTIVEKSDWIYLEIEDRYPKKIDLTIQTDDGRNISSDRIWRENDNIYILDDPSITYLFIYRPIGHLFDVLLELTEDSVYVGENIEAIITQINVGEPGLVNGTLTYSLSKEDEIIWSETENVSILRQRSSNKTISTIASAEQSFIVNSKTPIEGNPIWIYSLVIIVLVIVLINVIFFKKRYFYFKKNKEK